MIIQKLLRYSATLIFAGMVLLPIARADDSAANPEKTKLEPREVIRQALAKKINWDFNEMLLGEVVEALRNDLKIPIRLDMKAINDLGITPDVPITFKMSGISAKTALKNLLRDLGLTICIDEEILIITSPDVADANLSTVLYNVSDLPAFRRANGQTVPNYEKLIEVITKTIKPTSWDDVGGCGSILEYDAGGVQVLVISQTWEIHEEILDLLNRLRNIRPGPLSEDDIEKLPPEPPQKPKLQLPSPTNPGPARGGGMRGQGGGAQTPGSPGTEVPAADSPGTGAF
jgi:hypothetical protein